jgi:mRNA interferase MazF
MVKSFVPSRGDIVFLQFSPQQGREQSGLRPAFVLSPKEYNEKVGLLIACPITSHSKNYPFEVSLPRNLKTHGVILSDHIKSVDWKARKARFVEKTSAKTLQEVTQKLGLLLNV